jgi:haloacetate dehalogenase
MWHKVAPRLAADFTVVVPDLRGYGDSGKPEGDAEHRNYSKRVMGQDQVEVMQQLGFDRFYLVGHDRGARVSHRLTLDHPQQVLKLAVLDIIPTHRMFQVVNQEMATSTYHWFFLIQPYDFPERVIGANPDYFLRYRFERMANYQTIFPPEVLDEYARCFSDPKTIHATCEDYRAGASIDLVDDDEDFRGQQSDVPILCLVERKRLYGSNE